VNKDVCLLACLLAGKLLLTGVEMAWLQVTDARPDQLLTDRLNSRSGLGESRYLLNVLAYIANAAT